MATISIHVQEDLRNKIRTIRKHMREKQEGINFSEADVVRHMMLPGINAYLEKFNLAKTKESSGESQEAAG